MGVYGLAWTPAIIFKVIWALGPHCWFKGLLDPNWIICNFLKKNPKYGCLCYHLDLSNHFKVIWTMGPNFGSKGPLAVKSKIWNFLTKPQNIGVYGFACTSEFLRWFGPWQAFYSYELLIKLSPFLCFSENKIGKLWPVVCKTWFYLLPFNFPGRLAKLFGFLQGLPKVLFNSSPWFLFTEEVYGMLLTTLFCPSILRSHSVSLRKSVRKRQRIYEEKVKKE